VSGGPRQAAVAREAISLAIGFLTVDHLSKALEWSGTASQLGYPGATELHEACVRLDSAFRAVSAAAPSSAAVVEELCIAARVVGDLMVDTARALSESIPDTARGYADRQVLRAAERSYALRVLEPGVHPADP
jgi:hypothetical protein